MDRNVELERAAALHRAGSLDAAEAAYKALAAAFPRDAEIQAQWALVPLQAGRLTEGLRHLNVALRLNPRQPVVENNRGLALARLGRSKEAVESYSRAIAMAPDYAEAYENRATALTNAGSPASALPDFQRAMRDRANAPGLWTNLSLALGQLGRHADAFDASSRALALAPNVPEVILNHARALGAAGRDEESLAFYDRALSIAPDLAAAHRNRATLLRKLGRLTEAREGLERALALDPDLAFARGERLAVRLMLCDWRDYDRETAAVIQDVEAGLEPISPFVFMALPSSAAHQRKLARKHAMHFASLQAPPPRPYVHDRIRLAYISADFYEHATANLIARVIELHDRDRFEVYGLCLSPREDEMRRRLERGFDRLLDVSAMADADIAALARQMEIDIAIDLKGYTDNARPGLFAARAAPVQVSYLAYPGTMGAAFMDYLVADETIVPTSSRTHYSEKIVCLPHCYQAPDPTRQIAAATGPREQSGLPTSSFVFCCFNNAYKITPAVFDVWMRLLRNVSGSVLWLLDPGDEARKNLGSEAQARGVDPSRLVFAPKVAQAEHLARHALADLFLDTWPVNAHTTASDAIHAGLPVVTLLGQTFISRVAASILRAAGLPELVAGTVAEYEALALALAKDCDQLSALRRKLTLTAPDAVLFDTPRFVRGLEAAYSEMHRRVQAGLGPDHIRVDPNTVSN